MQVVGDDLGRRRRTAARSARSPSRKDAQRLGVAAGRRCGGRPTRASPLARQNVLLSSAPQASSGRARGDGQRQRRGDVARASGAAACGRPRTTRTTESSVRMWIGRSWTRKASAIAGEALARVVVAVGDRLVGDVAARQHERLAASASEQVVQRRVGQHHAELARRAARPPRRRGAPARRGASTIGRARPRRAAPRPSVVELDELARRGDVGRHQRERLVLAVLARAQRARPPLVVGAAREVVAAEALDRDDRAVAQQRGGRRDRVAGAGHASADQRAPRPARRAGVRLGVEAAVARVVVLGPAGGAHREARHRRQRPVVGDAAHDREARPAVRAVDERVAVAAVGRVEELAPGSPRTSRLSGDTSASAARRGAALATIAKPRAAERRDVARRATRSTRASGGASAAQRARGTRSTRVGRALDLEHDAALVVAARSPPSASSLGQPVDERAEADALDRRPRRARATRRRATASRRRHGVLHQLAQHVPRARLRLLDARDVLRARDDDVVGERPRRRSARRRSRRARSSRSAAPPRLGQRGEHVRASRRSSRAPAARRPARP